MESGLPSVRRTHRNARLTHVTDQPPSTAMHWLVIARAIGDIRKSAAAPMSVGSHRPRGGGLQPGPLGAGPLDAMAPGVATPPGRRVLTVMPCSASSSAQARL